MSNLKVVLSPNAPSPIGPYSQGIKYQNTLYVSGQIALNPETNTLIIDSIERETRYVLEHIKNIVEKGGSGISQIIKCSIFVADMNDFAKINEVYSAFFGEHQPARETVEVARLPKDARIEISCIAACDNE